MGSLRNFLWVFKKCFLIYDYNKVCGQENLNRKPEGKVKGVGTKIDFK